MKAFRSRTETPGGAAISRIDCVDRVHPVADDGELGRVEDHLVGQRLAAAPEGGRDPDALREERRGPEGHLGDPGPAARKDRSGERSARRSSTGWPVAGLTTTGGMAFANGAAVTSGMVAVTTVAPVATSVATICA